MTQTRDQKRPGAAGGGQTEQEPAVCPCSKEDQLHLGLLGSQYRITPGN